MYTKDLLIIHNISKIKSNDLILIKKKPDQIIEKIWAQDGSNKYKIRVRLPDYNVGDMFCNPL